MLSRLLSNDRPGGTLLSVLIAAIALSLATAPFLAPSLQALSVAAKVLVFITLVVGYDLLIGYAGIVSFAQTMFYGIGAYGVAIACSSLGANWSSLIVGVAGALVVSAILASSIAVFSLRVKSVFFSMITLAVASAFQTAASQLSDITGGEDGITFRLPVQLARSFGYFTNPITGATINGQHAAYYLLFVACLASVLLALRITNSPFGRVLLAIRENEFRAEAVGYNVLLYRTLASVLSAGFATIAGGMLAIWLQYTGPNTTLSFEIMIDVLLIVVIGGTGTIYGAIVGSAIFIVAQSYLRDLLVSVQPVTAPLPGIGPILSPDRWLLWLGLLFIITVYCVPEGLVGRLRGRTKLENRR